MINHYLLTTLLLFSGLAVGISDRRKVLYKDTSPRSTQIALPAYNFTMPIDHFSSDDTRMYNNRYYMNDTHYKKGGPVFFFDFGESGMTPTEAAGWLANSSTAIMQLAHEYNGLAIGWEHRYYGESQPFPETIISRPSHVNGTRETWQYLTQEQSLEDVVYFATHFAPDGYSDEQAAALRPSQTPWIWIGGSYPGSRGAWMRIRNPEIIYAVWSSSAPVQARADGSTYFDPIEASIPANCKSDIKAVVNHVDSILSGESNSTAYSQLRDLVYITTQTSTQELNANSSLSNTTDYSREDIASALTAPLVSNFQASGPGLTTHVFCNFMQSYDPTAFKATSNDVSAIFWAILKNPGNATHLEEGIAERYGVNFAVQAYMYATRAYYASSTKISASESSDTSEDQSNYQAWTYQYLTEFGWFQGSRPDNITIVSRYDNFTYERELAVAQYFRNQTDIIPPEPNVNHTLTKYGGWEMSPSNVMFTNGQFDPWRTFSVMSQEQDLGAPARSIVEAVPTCNQSPQGTDVFGLLYSGQVHASDLSWSPNSGNSASPLDRGMELFSKALNVWLPCFKPVTP